MSANKTYHVYIMTSQSRTLYVGFTNNIKRRVWEHKMGLVEGFTHRYRIDTLVYVESFRDVSCAIAREKQINPNISHYFRVISVRSVKARPYNNF